jgi:hypothetical protein
MTGTSDPWLEFDLLLGRVLDGTETEDDARRLNQILRTDPEACQRYLSSVHLHGRLSWSRGVSIGETVTRWTPAPGTKGEGGELQPGLLRPDPLALLPDIEAEESAMTSSDESEAQHAVSLLAVEAIPSDRPIGLRERFSEAGVAAGAPLPATFDPSFGLRFLAGGVWLSYICAALLMGIGLVAAWAWSPGNCATQIAVGRGASDLRQGGSLPEEPEGPSVGRITAINGCHFSDRQSSRAVVLGVTYAPSAGMIEITYDAGAKVVVEGPALYKVDSPNSGFLISGSVAVWGDLDARGGRSAGVREGLKPATGRSADPAPQSPFVIRTSDAVITDRGGEFAVDFSPSHVSNARVFRGKIDYALVGARAIPLGENDSLRVETRAQALVVSITRSSAQPLFLAATARGPDGGAGGWRMVNAGDQGPAGQSAPAAGTLLSLHSAPRAGGGTTWSYNYVLHTESALKEMRPGTARLYGWFIAHNWVTAIRLNGGNVAIPGPSGQNTTEQAGEFWTTEGLVDGQNVVEVDVAELSPMAVHVPLILYVEVRGAGVGKPLDAAGK